MRRCLGAKCSRCMSIFCPQCTYGKHNISSLCTKCRTNDLVSSIIALDMLPKVLWHEIFEYSYCPVCAKLKCVCHLRKNPCYPLTITSVGLVPIIRSSSRRRKKKRVNKIKRRVNKSSRRKRRT